MSAAREARQQAFALASAHYQAGELAEAEQLCRQILEADPRHAEALHMLAVIAQDGGYVDQAEGLLRRAVEASPRNAEYHNSLGTVLTTLGRHAEAEQCYRLAIKRRPGYAQAMSNLAAVLDRQLRFTEAVDWARRAVAISPYFAPLHNLGSSLTKLGRSGEAVDAYRRCIELAPGHWPTWSRLLLSQHCLPDTSPEEVFARHVQVGRGLAEGLPPPAAFDNAREPARRLRVGYVSADFRTGAVCHFILPVLRHHDRSAVEVFCYSDVGIADEVTERVRSAADAYRPTHSLSDEALAQAVRADGIDVLVDLSGHTHDRLALFGRRAAPVQVTYLGYPDTTGVAAIGYRLTDSLADPPGEADARATEKLIRLDPCAWCYAPLAPAPEVAAPRIGPVTFGSFNALGKVSEPTLDAWARILREVADSRLLVKTLSMNEASARQRFAHAMGTRGVPEQRLSLRGYQADGAAHLAAYGEVDVALDPFPYNGTTTTCDSLYMGVPVVALAGRMHVSRVGVSLLNAVGLGELVASDHDDYVRIAVALANDRPRLAALRAGLRERMRASPLMDAAGFCRRLEAAYREMWHGWCSQPAL